MAETVLVTGGTGYIALWCITGLLERGYQVRTSVRNWSKESEVRAAVAAETGNTDRLAFVVADLTDDRGWDNAMNSCDYVLHVASPLGDGASGSPDSLIAPARDGTLRVLRAATKAGVKRVVMTSAAAAARTPKSSEAVSDETVWADADDPRFDAYRRSKILAERAAWDFMWKNGPTEFTTILPGAVFGPTLLRGNRGSVQVIAGLLHGRPPALPRLGFWIVDVRDLADLHIRAMTSPAAAGQRFIAANDFMWMEDVATVLRAELGDRARKVPTRRMPDAVVRFLALFMPPLRGLTAELGRRNELTSAKARRVLGFAPRPAITTVVECAQSLLGSSAL
jgi:nucleoside-diphosphate-sugar epimerase